MTSKQLRNEMYLKLDSEFQTVESVVKYNALQKWLESI